MSRVIGTKIARHTSEMSGHRAGNGFVPSSSTIPQQSACCPAHQSPGRAPQIDMTIVVIGPIVRRVITVVVQA